MEDALIAEKAVVGCLLLSADGSESVYSKIAPDMFESELLKTIFENCLELHNKNEPIDIVLIISNIGEEYKKLVIECAETVQSLSNIEYYCEKVFDAWRIREMKTAALSLYSEENTSADMIQKFSEVVDRQNLIQAALCDTTAKNFTDSAVDFLKSLNQVDTSIKTRWTDFDHLVGGLMRKSVYAIAARPGKGKTDWAIQMATQVSFSNKVLYFTMEMPREQIMSRISSRATKINSIKIRDKKLTEEEKEKTAKALEVMCEHCKITFDEKSAITTAFIEEKIIKYKPDVVFIDHIGLMDMGNKKNAWEGVAENTHRLKALAMQYNIAVVELVQMKRDADRREATQGDMYGGASLEQDSDAVFGIEVEKLDHRLDGEECVEMKVKVLKNRHGGMGELKFFWQPQYHTYTQIDYER